MIISTLKKFLQFLISIGVALILSLVLLDTFSKSFFELSLGFLLFLGLVFLLIELAEKSTGWFVSAIVIFLGVAVSIDILFVGHILPNSFIQPAHYDIAQQYIDAVVANDISSAIALTNGSSTCQDQIRETFNSLEEELEKRYGADWREQELEDVIIMNVYILPEPQRQESFSIVVYKEGEDYSSTPYIITGLITSHPIVGKRYTCGMNIIQK